MNQNKQTATELFIIQPEAGAHSPQRTLKAIHRDRKIQELKECGTKKIRLGNMHKEYLYTVCYCCIVYLILHLYSKHYIKLIFFMSRRNSTFWSKEGETGVGEQGISLRV